MRSFNYSRHLITRSEAYFAKAGSSPSLMLRLLPVGVAGVGPFLCSLGFVYVFILLVMSMGEYGGIRNIVHSVKVGL